MTPSTEFNHKRPELNQTIIFGEVPKLDLEPIEAANGRLIPGYKFSERESRLLWNLAKDQGDGRSLELFILPTVKQLGRISLASGMGCWELPTYNDTKNRARYGRLSIDGISSSLAHRCMYQVFYGVDSLSDQDLLDHLCENTACCYPRHLEAVSPATNSSRGKSSLRRADKDQAPFDWD